MYAQRKDSSQTISRILLVAAAVLGGGDAKGAESDEADAASSRLPSSEQSVVRAYEDAAITEAIRTGTVLVGMTTDQVLSARGAPLRREAIPPNAELWHYAGGEVAFSQNRATYVGLKAAPATPAASKPGPADEVAREIPEQPPGEATGELDTARVNTPGDGFLALRSEPTVRRGGRLLKVPHGTRLMLDGCVTSPADGRWCSTTFKGRKGWVLDRYLVR